MIDAYVNHAPDVDPFWLQQCLASVRADPAANLVDAGCVPGQINATRDASFARGGDSEFYCFIDGDDLLVPGAIHLCQKYLREHPDCQFVRTREVLIDEVGHAMQTPIARPVLTLEAMCTHPGAAHHLIVTRKSFIEAARPLLQKYAVHWDWIAAAFAFKLGHGVLLPWVGYQWRQHKSQWSRGNEASAMIGAISADLKAALL